MKPEESIGCLILMIPITFVIMMMIFGLFLLFFSVKTALGVAFLAGPALFAFVALLVVASTK